MKKVILLVDDQPEVFDILKELPQDKYDFIYTNDFANIKEYLNKKKVDLVLMDWNLGGFSGIELIKEIRGDSKLFDVPIVMLSANGQTQDMVEGLGKGADDYVTKPVQLPLLTARIDATLRKTTRLFTANQKICFNDNVYEVTIGSFKETFRKKEYRILKLLVENPHRTFSRKEINSITSNGDAYVSPRCVDTFVRYLRKKLPSPTLIQSINRKGYKINEVELSKLMDSESVEEVNQVTATPVVS